MPLNDTQRQLTLADGMALAEDMRRLLYPVVQRVEVAGSLRRGVETVKDIELVAVPRLTALQPDLFGTSDNGITRNALDECIAAHIESGTFSPRIAKDGKQAVGSKFKRLWYHAPEREPVALDLFSVIAPAQWGAVFAIRTGPAGFSHLCVTPRSQGGAMPYGMRQQDGALWRGETMLETPTEAHWFDTLGLPILSPEQRSEEWLRPYLRGAANGR